MLRSNIVYYYDGSYDGLMTCVFMSFAEKEMPVAIEPDDKKQETVFPTKEIYTDHVLAERVKRSIPEKIGLSAKELVESAFLTDLFEKELHILCFLRLGYRTGSKIMDMTENEHVEAMETAVLKLSREAHHLTGFIHFSEYGGILMSQISPRNNILPLIADHFCDRMAGKDFMIFDRSHSMALIYRNGRRSYVWSGDEEPPPLSPEENRYRGMWKNFFETIESDGSVRQAPNQVLPPLKYR